MIPTQHFRKKPQNAAIEMDRRLASDIGSFFYDPYSYVLYNWAWGVKGSPLESWDGPDQWQIDVMEAIRESLQSSDVSTKISVSAGHGVGKSALMSWLMKWWQDTRFLCKGVATAGTKTQLATKLWPELAVWCNRSRTAHWTNWMATSLQRVGEGYDPKVQRIDAIPWSSENPDAFAGLHAVQMQDGVNVAGSLVLYDEASTIDPTIWETSQGAMTDPGGLWVAFGNPVRSSGYFFDTFHKFKTWKTFKVNAELARMPNKAELKEWEEEYGRDSDFFKVRVLGEFPRVGSMQLIPSDLVKRARSNKTAVASEDDVRVLSVDVARFGDDASVLLFRHGNVVTKLQEERGKDLMELADIVAEAINSFSPDLTLIDGVGVGGGVVDRLRQLNFDVVDVNGGSRSIEPETFSNLRTQIYFSVRKWLLQDVSIPDNDLLEQELVGIEYGFVSEKTMKLERKEDFKKRIGRSPDYADALALSFAVPVIAQHRNNSDHFHVRQTTTDWRLN